VRGCACRGTAGLAHVSCLAEQAKILFAEAEENNLDGKAKDARWKRWHACSLCEQHYHGVVACALGWACWKTYLGRPETDWARMIAMVLLGNGLFAAGQMTNALLVQEAELSMRRRIGSSEYNILASQNNLAGTYEALGRFEDNLRMRRDVYLGFLKLDGEESIETITATSNYAATLVELERFEETKVLLRKMIPVARRVLGENAQATLLMRGFYAQSLCGDANATLDDVYEAVNSLEETTRTARRVFGGAHPLTVEIEDDLRGARGALAARETPGSS
jgi:hypothetical protein